MRGVARGPGRDGGGKVRLACRGSRHAGLHLHRKEMLLLLVGTHCLVLQLKLLLLLLLHLLPVLAQLLLVLLHQHG